MKLTITSKNLVASKPFLDGVAKVLDIGSRYSLKVSIKRKNYVQYDRNALSDPDKLKSDWERVGKDIEKAIIKYNESTSR